MGMMNTPVNESGSCNFHVQGRNREYGVTMASQLMFAIRDFWKKELGKTGTPDHDEVFKIMFDNRDIFDYCFRTVDSTGYRILFIWVKQPD